METNKPILLCRAGKCCPKLTINGGDSFTIDDDYGHSGTFTRQQLLGFVVASSKLPSSDSVSLGEVTMRADQATLIPDHI